MGSSCSSGQGSKDNLNGKSKSSSQPGHGKSSKSSSNNDVVHTSDSKSKHCNLSVSDEGKTLSPNNVTVETTSSSQLFTNEETDLVQKPPETDQQIPSTVTSQTAINPTGNSSIFSNSGLGVTATSSEPDQFPDNIQALLQGQIKNVNEVLHPRKIRIYVCAHYRDSIVERNTIVEHVYPNLRQHCADKGFELDIVDLHWGLRYRHFNDHSLPDLCNREIQTTSHMQHVIYVVFLNEKYRSNSCPKYLDATDFESLIELISNDFDKELVQIWYKRDDNAVPPQYVLQPISACVYNYRDTNREIRISADNEWAYTMSNITQIIYSVCDPELKAKYFTPVLEKELFDSILTSEDEVPNAIWIQRLFNNFNVSSEAAIDYVDLLADSTEIDQEAKEGLQNLQTKLMEKIVSNNIIKFRIPWNEKGICPLEVPEHAQYVNQLCEKYRLLLKKQINTIIEDRENMESSQVIKKISDRLYNELVQQSTAYSQEYELFEGQQNIIDHVESYLKSDATVPLVIYGNAGCGKTALMAMIAQKCFEWLENAACIIRFIGLTPESSTVEGVLHSISEQICYLYGEHPSLASKSLKDHVTMFTKILRKVSPQKPLIVLLDGIGQTKTYGSKNIDWIPAELPVNVRLIVSVRDSTEQLEQLQKVIPSSCFLEMYKLSSDESWSLVEANLNKKRRTITAIQKENILSILQQNSLPLVSEVISSIAGLYSSRMLGSDMTLHKNITSLINAMFHHLEQTCGLTELSHILGYLTAVKHGLTDSEINDLLSCDESVLEKVYGYTLPEIQRIPSALWSRVRYELSPFLHRVFVNGSSLTTWKNNFLRFVATQRYLSSPQQISAIYNSLIDYFEGRWANGKKKPCPDVKEGIDILMNRFVLNQPLKYEEVYNNRKLVEYPYCAFYCNHKLKDMLFNPEWIYSKITAVSVYYYLEDIHLALTKNPNDLDLHLLYDVLQCSSYALLENGTQIFAQIYGRLHNFFSSEENCLKFTLMKNLFDVASQSPYYSLIPSPTCLSQPGVTAAADDDDEESKKATISMLFKIKNNPSFVVSVAPDKGEIIVWNIKTQEAIRTLTGIDQPREIRMIDSVKAVVLSNRELKIYHLDDGKFDTKLKGVMNQVMPFYGVHDNNHVVALSRNRMCVNMFNLETGEMVSTFKVGEDRFLNSLLVSSNGQICVCGDETQKPFPLLVWDLSNRKLMYDLRIPGHEFLTKMAAISSDGHYVVSVCREVDDPAPSHIIVYDLQSGTLFKKWKPNYSTCSITISSESGVVINGLEDNSIQVWDLQTGSCRNTLRGHSYPVDKFYLSENGERCLSFDSTGRDRTLRLWNVLKGFLLTSFTPDEPASACEITANGDAVIMGLPGASTVVTLWLHSQDHPANCSDDEIAYGDPSRKGQIFDLSNAG